MKNIASLTTVCAVAVFGVAVIATNQVETAYAGPGDRPTVVELFTSQSCYSCPPAERFLGELAERPNLIALEFHVDYWDELVWGNDGKWKDRFSQSAYTHRQRAYASVLPGGRSYTPQMVIGGRSFAVGSRRRTVLSAIKKVSSGGDPALDVEVSSRGNGGVDIRVMGPVSKQAMIWLVKYKKSATTRVRAGENKGKTLTNHNIVLKVERVGIWRGKPVTVKVPSLELFEGQSCAILVQSERMGPILGSARCPAIIS